MGPCVPSATSRNPAYPHHFGMERFHVLIASVLLLLPVSCLPILAGRDSSEIVCQFGNDPFFLPSQLWSSCRDYGFYTRRYESYQYYLGHYCSMPTLHRHFQSLGIHLVCVLFMRVLFAKLSNRPRE
jgi:hypothetical protein